MSSDGPVDLRMLNVVADDMAASLDFYRRLGIAVPVSGEGASAHVQLSMPGGFSLELVPRPATFAPSDSSCWEAGQDAEPDVVAVALAGGCGCVQSVWFWTRLGPVSAAQRTAAIDITGRH